MNRSLLAALSLAITAFPEDAIEKPEPLIPKPKPRRNQNNGLAPWDGIVPENETRQQRRERERKATTR
jgi:hypothetical protein